MDNNITTKHPFSQAMQIWSKTYGDMLRAQWDIFAKLNPQGAKLTRDFMDQAAMDCSYFATEMGRLQTRLNSSPRPKIISHETSHDSAPSVLG